MAENIRMQGGALLLWRLGPLEYGEQSRWSRAPESRGMWAFPWPFFDDWFALHQYSYLMPKRLRGTSSGWPEHRSWYVDATGRTPDRVDFEPGGRPIDRTLETREGFDEAREEWVRTVGRRILPRRQFFYSGDVYTHLRPNGDVLDPGTLSGDGEWCRMDIGSFAEALRRCGANHTYDRWGGTGRVERFRTSLDHLEVFLPAGAGRIHGRAPSRADARSSARRCA